MTDIPRYAIILTHNRHELLLQSLAAIRSQADITVIIDNASDPPVTLGTFPADGNPFLLMEVPDQPPNLSHLWNLGLEAIGRLNPVPQWDVALLCDDVIVPEDWYNVVSSCMREHGAAAGSTHQWHEVTQPILKQAPDRDLTNRMCGWAFVLAGEKGLQADEDLKWWFCDTDLDWQARANGGMVICPGPVAKNIHPGEFTGSKPELYHQSGLDGVTFARKHGSRPW